MVRKNTCCAIFPGGVAAIVTTSGCEREEEIAAVEPVRPVKTVRFGDKTGERTLNYPGKVYPNTTVQVAFEVSGRLSEL